MAKARQSVILVVGTDMVISTVSKVIPSHVICVLGGVDLSVASSSPKSVMSERALLYAVVAVAWLDSAPAISSIYESALKCSLRRSQTKACVRRCINIAAQRKPKGGAMSIT